MDGTAWNIIHKYFNDNPFNLVAHHLDSYNDFYNKGIFQIIKENNPIRFIETKNQDDPDAPRAECFCYIGGKTGDRLYFGKPIIYDETDDHGQLKPHPHYMYPNDARLRSMTYGSTIHYDVDVDFVYYIDGLQQKSEMQLEKMYLGTFPIMVNSNQCILNGLSRTVKFNMGECLNDYGGYFIINGKEKCILSQEKFGDNMIYVKKHKDDIYSYSCEVRSVSEDSSKPIRYTSIRLLEPTAKNPYNDLLVVDVPNVSKPVPLFILMRALGVLSDRDIIQYCLLDLEANKNMVDLFIPSVHDACGIFTQDLALNYIKSFTKRNTITHVLYLLTNYFLPHVGEENFTDKAYYIGFMVRKLLNVYTGIEEPTDRDNFKFKRVETSGSLIYDLFREYYQLQLHDMWLKLDKAFYYNPGFYRKNLAKLVENNYKNIFKNGVVEDGFKKGFRGNWGASPKTKRIGLVQDLNRLSWYTFISHLRKINLPLDPTSKVYKPHLLHNSQWGIIDPVDTPDGGSVGLHKHMAICTVITNKYAGINLIKWIRANTQLKLLQECSPNILFQKTKVFVNGNWIGVIGNPMETVDKLKTFRRNGIIPVYTSITFNCKDNVVYLFTDAGRLMRPIYYKSIDGKMSYSALEEKIFKDQTTWKDVSWSKLVSGFMPKNDDLFNIRNNVIYDLNVLYPNIATDPAKLLLELKGNAATIDYIDTSESENALIAFDKDQLKLNKYYTHLELEKSLLFGVMGNSIIYPEFNQLPRDVFSCGQSRQAVSLYHSNYQMRLDKMGVVLNYGQIPLVKSKYLEYINHEEQPYGVNTIVAIASYTGYNVEDAILINKSSIERGLFNTSYFTTYEAHEESVKVPGTSVNSVFTNIEAKHSLIKNLKEDFDYSYLDEHGLVKEGTVINDRIVLIGQLNTGVSDNKNISEQSKAIFTDVSKTTKKGQLGYVDKSFISEGEEGFRIAKIRVCENRQPNIGDKMASRAGQKGTIGLIIPEEDMPFTADGLKPDLIINPHALPSRMTIGQLLESLFGKVCSLYGSYGNMTAFATKGPNLKTYGNMLNNLGYHRSGNQILYNGFTGQPLHSEIFIGPTYYMRLKHMVKDKINYRATGKRSHLTRQTNQGRANDGGLRIGEMERDGIMGHGMAGFLNDAFMVRGDEYYMAVCNKTGSIAVYNPSKNIFLSPDIDGPLKFDKNVHGDPVLDTVSRYGRSFSVVRVPYALKLLMQELEIMGVKMKIITDENIDQLMNLSYESGNLQKLLNKPEDEPTMDVIKSYIEELTKKYSVTREDRQQMVLNKQGKAPPDLRNEMENLDAEYGPKPPPGQLQPLGSPQYPPPGSPQYPPPGSPQYPPPGSPQYPPPGSPPYPPGTPEYPPAGSQEVSPPYAPNSPTSGGRPMDSLDFFNNETMNLYFKRLPINKQNVIRSLGPIKGADIMTKIIQQVAPQGVYTTVTNPSDLLEERLFSGKKVMFKTAEDIDKSKADKKDADTSETSSSANTNSSPSNEDISNAPSSTAFKVKKLN